MISVGKNEATYADNTRQMYALLTRMRKAPAANFASWKVGFFSPSLAIHRHNLPPKAAKAMEVAIPR